MVQGRPVEAARRRLAYRRISAQNPGMIVVARGMSAALLVVFAVGAAACGSSAKKTTPATSTTTSSIAAATTTRSSATSATTASTSPATTLGTTTGWTRPRERADGSLPIAAFNALLDRNHSSWTHSPLRISVEFLHLDDTAANTTTVRVSTNADSLHETDVVVTAAGLLDDSVRAGRNDLHLARQSDESWRLTSARWSQQCQPNRGHQDFTTQPCI
jgi:hypothetical protein